MGRLRFQYSLLTAVVVMVVAGGLLGLNMRKYPLPPESPEFFLPMSPEAQDFRMSGNSCHVATNARGWPFCAHVFVILSEAPIARGENLMWFGRWHWGSLVTDVLVALTIIIASGVLCEWLVRRRTPRSPPKEA